MADLQRVESMQYPAGHLAHLTDNQQQQLQAFEKICADQGYYTPAIGGRAASHDDETMLRYLRARRFVPQEAFKQFKDTEDWRKDNKLDQIFETIDIEEFEQTRRLYPQWLGRRDKRGIPLFLFEVLPLNTKNIGAYEKALAKSKTTVPKVLTKNVRLFALYESLTRFVTPLCSMVPRNHPETPISQSNNIVDIQGVGLKQFWNLKGHMQDASVLATAHYPETLDRIFIVGAPSFFPTVWGWIKRWFDPITVSKIFILSPANVYPTLSQYIDHENIPKKYGGGLDFEFGQMPNIEPAMDETFRWENPDTAKGKKTFPIGPIRWEEGPHGEMQAWGVGSENGQPRRRLVFTIPHPVGWNPTGPSVPNTPAYQIGDPLTTVGTATHPPDTGRDSIDEQPPPDTPSDADARSRAPSMDPGYNTMNPGSNTMTLPIRSSTSDNRYEQPAQTPASAQQPEGIRSGTSDSRYEQQAPTHASGQLSDGTPHAAINHHGAGDNTVTMEPNTVGQAPKEIPLPEPEQPAAPGYIEQARQAAANATATVSSTVGSVAGTVMGAVTGHKEEVKTVEEPVVRSKSPEERQLDDKIDRVADGDVEAFLRERSSGGGK